MATPGTAFAQLRPAASAAALAAAVSAAVTAASGTAWAEGLYLGARAAGAYMQPFETDFSDPVRGRGTLDLRHRLGFVAGGSVGYDFAPLRAEIEGVYARTEIKEAKTRIAGVTATAAGSDRYMNLAGALANLYLDVPAGGDLRPYVGAGVGWGWSRLGERQTDSYVYQAALGLDMPLGDGLTLGAGYRFLGFPVRNYNDGTPGRRFSTEHAGVHAVGIGMRLTFEPDRSQERARASAGAQAWPSAPAALDAQDDAASALPAGAAKGDADAKAYAALRQARAAAAQSGQARRDAPVEMPRSARAAAVSRNGLGASGAETEGGPVQLPAPTRPVVPASRQPVAASVPGGSGAFGVQIGSFRERNHAVEAWPAKQREYGRLLQGLTPAVVEATVPGKGRWYRLYAAGLGRDAADRLCGAIKQRGDFCAIATL